MLNDNNIVGKFIYYPWIKGVKDELIHPEDIDLISGLGVVKVIGIANQYLIVETNQITLRVLKNGINLILPYPEFIVNEKIHLTSNPHKIGTIRSFFWHHKDNKFYFQVDFIDKKSTKRYASGELSKIIK